ncbi:NAD-dependent glycerol dehydrogenase [bioreactor metagenome]|uniref:NAD-dependent glycerol dehydrogenase n=1 Tax=bioreactor metagenome TaxID=1076179 RepID=A0A645DZL0_9ZZZZ
MAKAQKVMPTIDILVNNAGTSSTKRAEYITEEEWDRVIDLNLKSIFFLSQAVGKVMMEHKGGKIINIASMLGLVAIKGVLPYCVAKGGLIQMTKALALEWARKGITVNALCPGYVITDINRENMSRPEVMEKLVAQMPLGRCGEVAEIAQGALFLACEGSSYMTGQCLVLDGGYTAQ